MAKQERGPRSPEMNMTPLIDVTFQLIIFFMLVNNIISEENVELKVPKLHDPKVKELGDVRRVVVNVKPPSLGGNPDDRFQKKGFHWLDVNGEADTVRVGANEEYVIGRDDHLITASLEKAVKDNTEVQVLLRADGGTYYKNMQPVMAAITKAGIKTVNLVAYMPDQGPTEIETNKLSKEQIR